MTKQNYRISKILLLVFAFATSSSLLFGQNDCKYKSYFSNVGEASFDAFSKNFESAQLKYKKAFSEIDFPLGQDLRKALKVAVQVKDSTWVGELSIILAKGGIPMSYFKKFEDYSWYPKFQSEYTIYQDYYKSNFDLDLRQQLLDVRRQDSLTNDDFHKWRKGQKPITLEQLTVDAKKVFNTFKTMHEIYGFPSEQKMGYYFNDCEQEIDNFPILVLLIHIHQRGELYLEGHFAEFVCEGKIRPEFKDAMMA